MKAQDKDSILHDILEMSKASPYVGYAAMASAPQVQDHLRQRPGVKEVRDYRGSDLTVKFEDDSLVTVLLGREYSYGGPAGLAIAGPAGEPAADPASHPNWIRAGVIDPLWDDWPPKATPRGVVDVLKAQGYRVDHLKGKSVDLEMMAGLAEQQYGAIFVRTHGGIQWVGDDPKLHMMVRPYFDSWPPDSGYTGVGVFYVGTNWGNKYAYAFNDQFVSAYLNATPFPNTLLHLLVCFGAAPEAQNDMIPAFLNRGVGSYSGWTVTASSAYGDPAAVTFFERLAAGQTVAQAVADIAAAGSSPDPETGAVLVVHGDGGMCLALPLVGNKRSKQLHQPTCRSARRMSLKNVVLFETQVEAQSAGYRPCSNCLPAGGGN